MIKKFSKMFLIAVFILVAFQNVYAETEAETVVRLQAQIAEITRQLQAFQRAQTGTTFVNCSLVSNSDLIVGTRSPNVECLQRILSSKGLLSSENITGFYGPLTTSAVRSFQAGRGIVSSGDPQTTGYGAVGPRTLQALSQSDSSVSNANVITANASTLPVSQTSVPATTRPTGWASYYLGLGTSSAIPTVSTNSTNNTSTQPSGFSSVNIYSPGVSGPGWGDWIVANLPANVTRTLQAGTASGFITLSTMSDARCAWSVNPNATFSSMRLFSYVSSDEYKKTHFNDPANYVITFTNGIRNSNGGTDYTYYANCINRLGNTNTSNFPIRFTAGNVSSSSSGVPVQSPNTGGSCPVGFFPSTSACPAGYVKVLSSSTGGAGDYCFAASPNTTVSTPTSGVTVSGQIQYAFGEVGVGVRAVAPVGVNSVTLNLNTDVDTQCYTYNGAPTSSRTPSGRSHSYTFTREQIIDGQVRTQIHCQDVRYTCSGNAGEWVRDTQIIFQ